MSRHGNIEFDWGDGKYRFRLDYEAVCELQDVWDAGPAWVAERLKGMEWRVQDVRETLRRGLIGGGKTQDEALRLIRKFVDARPWMENARYARAVILAFLAGDAEEIVGKLSGEETEANPSPVEKSPSEDFSATLS